MIQSIRPRLRVVFFRSPNGKEPVREWLLELSQQERKVVGEDLNECSLAGLSGCR